MGEISIQKLAQLLHRVDKLKNSSSSSSSSSSSKRTIISEESLHVVVEAAVVDVSVSFLKLGWKSCYLLIQHITETEKQKFPIADSLSLSGSYP
ncbi:hypothetical protein T4D_6728 [Trichinella pseudospiralis]|uniref:Uncharacterized protein n=1 Tax=Trichinella pseudospiralis TaxID=6337 RepID=A0A0V1FS66_TRIPS|nr:hypothetical protein T4D_6728 [Trichinella pseudospiralis]